MAGITARSLSERAVISRDADAVETARQANSDSAKAQYSRTLISTRRFSARPSAVSLEATGCAAP